MLEVLIDILIFAVIIGIGCALSELAKIRRAVETTAFHSVPIRHHQPSSLQRALAGGPSVLPREPCVAPMPPVRPTPGALRDPGHPLHMIDTAKGIEFMNIKFGRRFRHLGRGSEYIVLNRSKLQIGPETLKKMMHDVRGSSENFYKCLSERLEALSLVNYYCEKDQSTWTRPESEFVDGRFESVEDKR